MSKKKNLPRPSNAELGILRVLWQHGPCTVRQVYDVLNLDKPTGYTTVLKFMQIMTVKGLVVRDARRSHLHNPAVPAENTQRQLVADLLEQVCEDPPKS